MGKASEREEEVVEVLTEEEMEEDNQKIIEKIEELHKQAEIDREKRKKRNKVLTIGGIGLAAFLGGVFLGSRRHGKEAGDDQTIVYNLDPVDDSADDSEETECPGD